MSYPDPATDQLRTAEQPADSDALADQVTTAQHDAYPAPQDQSGSPEDDDYLDDDEEWVSQAPKGWRVRGTTAVLLLLLFAAAGFWGGSALQKHHDKASTSTAAASAASRFAAARGGTGTGTAGRGSAGAGSGAGASGTGGGFARNGTVGIVTTVEGSTVYVTDSSGNLVKVATNPSSTVTKTVSGTVGDLQPGQTVIVQGSKAPDGTTTARSITIAPAGSGFGAIGRLGGGGGSGGGGGGGFGGSGGATTGAGGGGGG
jgi:hypothetical protein